MPSKLHKIIFFLVFSIGIVVKTAAQDSYVVLQNSMHRAKVEYHAGNTYKWGVFLDEYGNNRAPDYSYSFENDTDNLNEISVIFTTEGQYHLIVSETELQGCTTRRAAEIIVESDENATAEITADNEWVCSETNGESKNSTVKLRVNYSGAKPWTFKYSVNKAPPEQPEGANEIHYDYFEFELSYRNEEPRTRSFEVSLVDVKPIFGTPLESDDNHSTTFKVLPLSAPVLLRYQHVVSTGVTKNYNVEVNKNSQCKIILPDQAELLDKYNSILPDGINQQVNFNVQWGNVAGDYQIKILEENALNCSSDTIYADIEVVDGFKMSLGEDIEVCYGEKIELTPTIDLPGNYTYLWNDNTTENILEVNESGEYSVTVTNNDNGDSDTARVNVIIHPLPIVDLGSDITLYNGESAELNAGFTDESTTYQWNTGDTTQKITVSSENVYSVDVTDKNGCQNTDEIYVITKEGQEFSVYIGEDQEICEGDSIYLEPIITPNLQQEPTYVWTPTGLTERGIYVKKSGEHCVDVTDQFDNVAIDCMTLDVNPEPYVNLGTDLTINNGETVLLDARNEGSFYNWSTGEITQTIEVDEADRYWVEVTDHKYCVGKDTIVVDYYNEYDQFVGLPTGFSPNGDGVNDVLYVRGRDIASMTLIIKNRIGQIVFQSNNQDDGWDGTSQGKKLDMDVYVYILKITLPNGKTISKQGNVTLLN